MIDKKLLIEKAFDAQKYCYTPYSNFNVGAALLCENGEIYQGCNLSLIHILYILFLSVP